MEGNKECPECGNKVIGRGQWKGYASLQPAGKLFSMGSEVQVDVCTECGLIMGMRAKKPEKFK